MTDFRKRVEKDSRINGKFARTDIARLDAMLIDQVCEATGGPYRYTGRNMRDAHKGMQVTAGEFNALVVEVQSSDTRTALPDAYRAAPPLAKA